MYVSGVFNGETTSPSHRADIPAIFAVNVKNATSIGVLMDIETGTYHRRGYLANSESSWYELRWYAHRNLRSLYVMELETHLTESEATIDFETNDKMTSADIKFETPHSFSGDNSLSMCGQTITPETTDGSPQTVEKF